MKIYFHGKKEYICIDDEDDFNEVEQGHLLFSLISLVKSKNSSPSFQIDSLDELLSEFFLKSKVLGELFLKDLENIFDESDYNKVINTGYFNKVFKKFKKDFKVNTKLMYLKDSKENEDKVKKFLRLYADLIYLYYNVIKDTINIIYHKESIDNIKEFNNVYRYKKLYPKHTNQTLISSIEEYVRNLGYSVSEEKVKIFLPSYEDYFLLSLVVGGKYKPEIFNDNYTNKNSHTDKRIDNVLLEYLSTGEVKENLFAENQKLDLSSENVDIVSIFYTNTLVKALNIEYMYFVENNIKTKRCNNCNMYFVPVNIKAEYCNNIYKDTGKPCSEIGRFIARKKKIEEDEILKIYKKVYAKLNMRHRRNSDVYTKEMFDDWVEYAEDLMLLANIGRLTPEQFEELIDGSLK